MRINHINVVTADMAKSLDFYVGLLGMRVTFEVDLTGEWIDTVAGLVGVSARCVFVQPDGGGGRIELLEYRLPLGANPEANRLANTRGLRHIAIEVDHLDDWYQRIKEAGVYTFSAPVAVPFRIVDGIQKRLFYLHDPDGTIVELCEHLTRKEIDHDPR
jgi:catechol 2,3-dioxygenase-like lactoylglutathione lyase family enzyme